MAGATVTTVTAMQAQHAAAARRNPGVQLKPFIDR
jgi:uncharacterized phosphosugar-binding protein